MPLTLEVIGEKTARMGAAARKTFTAGGSIGRLADNDWVFPDKYISGHHARILFNQGVFLIEDTSTNGVFLNSQQNRLPRGKPHPLRSGDIIFIDDYEVRVTVNPEPAAVPSYAPQRQGGSLIPDTSPLIPESRPSMSEDRFFDDAPDAIGAPSAADPLALLGLQSAPAIPVGPTLESLQSSSPLSQHYKPPTAVAPAEPPRPAPSPGFIPDDYDPMGADDDPFGTPPIPKPAPSSARPAAGPPAAPTLVTGPLRVPTPGARSPQQGRPDRPAAGPIGADPFESAPTPGRRSAERPRPESNAALRPESAAAPRQEPTRSAPPARAEGAVPQPGAERRRVPERRTPAAGEQLDFAAMLRGAGLDSVHATPELAEKFGMILRVVVAGVMDVLQARDKIKNEFRMRMTTFKQADNNPLKFSANIEDALHNLLVKRNPAYLGPVEAFEDAFLDVRNHQMAMLAGVRVAFEAMLEDFDPDRLQKEFDANAKGGNFLGGGAKAKYWDLYRARFRDMVKDADSSFRKLFGDDFAKAYEEQLSRLKAANRPGRR
jgi:type VI secretion system FHA domain protein